MLRNKNSEKYSELHPKRILYSQNFLKNKAQVYHLVNNSSITNEDIVVEVGPGKGVITKFLLQNAKEVIAVEIDDEIIVKLKEKFRDSTNLNIVKRDIRDFILPTESYKVFSNIPFNITADILKKFLNYNKGPTEAYLIMQVEAVRRFGGLPFGKESLISLLNKPFFKFEKFYSFLPSDFDPAPNASVMMVKITKRKIPLIENKDKELFEDFLTFAFLNQKARITRSLEKIFTYSQFSLMSKNIGFDIHSSVSDLNITNWLALFEVFKTKVTPDKQNKVRGYKMLHLKMQPKTKKANYK